MITEFFINENDKIFELEILREYIKKLESEETTILKAMPIKTCPPTPKWNSAPTPINSCPSSL